MKIYFCGSIRGGRELAERYGRMVAALKEYGEVLTEHVGSQTLTHFGGDGTNEFIYRRDTAKLRECDILLAECTVPSLGVGYEIAYGEALGKPVHIFYGGEDPRRLSAMLAGNTALHIHYYRTDAELLQQISDVFHQ